MKILILSFYFQPDLSAGSFRTTALVNELERMAPEGSHIEVVTTLPNRYGTFSVEAPQTESRQGLTIRRIAVPPHRSGMIDQSRTFLAYARAALRHADSEDFDIVYATSSRLMTAALGAWIARRKRASLYLDIRDIFADTMKDILPRHLGVLAGPAFSGIERWTISCADRVNLVSRGFSGYFTGRYPQKRFSYFTNGIDDEFVAIAQSVEETALKKEGDEVVVLYAGNLGEGQGLHLILPKLAARMGHRVRFRIIGDGGRKDVLRSALVAAGVDNVDLMAPMKRDHLIDAYREADVLFLHLNDYDAFKKVLPSKLFEYAAMGKPIWAGVSGYAAEFVHSEIDNAAVFHPCDEVEAERVFRTLAMRDVPRRTFVEKYARGDISKRLAEDILVLAKRNSTTLDQADSVDGKC